MLILGILGYMLTYIYIRGNPPNPTYTPQPQQQQLRINQFQVYKCQDCLKWPMVPKISMKSLWKDYKIPKQMSKTLAQVFGGFSWVFHGLFTGFSRSRFCGKFQVGTFTRSYSVLYLVTSWSKMQTFVQSPCSQAHFTCIELNQIASALSTYLLTMISQHNMWASRKNMYNGYKHSYKKEHLPRARLNLAVSKDQVKLGRGRAGFGGFFFLTNWMASRARKLFTSFAQAHVRASFAQARNHVENWNRNEWIYNEKGYTT